MSAKRILYPLNMIIMACMLIFYGIYCETAFAGFMMPRYIRLDRPKFRGKLSFEYDQDKRSDPISKSKDTRQEFHEGFNVESNGWIYHPRLLSFDFNVEPEWQQAKQDYSAEEGSGSNPKSFLIGYHLGLSVLKEKPYALNLYGNRSNSRQTGGSSYRTENETTSYGASMNVSNRILPVNIQFEHFINKETGSINSDEKQNNLIMSMTNRLSRNYTTLVIDYSDDTRTVNDNYGSSTERYNVSLRNNYNSEDGSKSFGSDITLDNTSNNSLDSSQYNFFNTFRWRHRENLISSYSASYSQRESGGSESDAMSLNTSLSHVLYENLTTSLNAGISTNDTSTGGKDEYKGGGNISYKRPVLFSWGGFNLFTNHGYNISKQNVSGTESHPWIKGESHTLNSSDNIPAYLDSENVDISSVVVTDKDEIVTYIKDFDYSLLEEGSKVRIKRLIGGEINDGDTIMVSYTYMSSEPTHSEATFTQMYGFDFRLMDFFGLNYSFQRLSQKILSGTIYDEPDRSKSHHFDVSSRWRWSDTTFNFDLLDDNNSDLSRSWVLKETIRMLPGLRSANCDLSGYYGRRYYREDEDNEKYYALRSNIRTTFLRRWGVRFECYWENVRSMDEQSTDIGFSSYLNYSIGIWSFDLSYKYVNETDDVNDTDHTRNTTAITVNRALW